MAVAEPAPFPTKPEQVSGCMHASGCDEGEKLVERLAANT
jgi:hypothetical protein